MRQILSQIQCACKFLLTLMWVLPGVATAAPGVLLEPVTHASAPTYIHNVGDERLFIVEQEGVIRIWKPGTGTKVSKSTPNPSWPTYRLPTNWPGVWRAPE